MRSNASAHHEFTMTSARQPSDGEIIQKTTMTRAGAEAAGGTASADTSNLTDDDDNDEQAAAAQWNRSKQEEEEDDRKKKEEAEAALMVFLECWLRHWKEDVARKKEEEEDARKKKEDAARKQQEEEEASEKKNFFERQRDKLMESIERDWQRWEVKKEALDKMREWLMLLATIAVSIAYAAGLNPPGGVWQDDSPGHHTAGTPVLQTNDRARYLTFYYSNALSFVTSLVIVALLINRKASVQLLVFVTLFDLMCLEVAYLAGTTSGLLLSIPLIVTASAAFIYVAYGILVLVFLGALATLATCLSLLCFLPCIAALLMDSAFHKGEPKRDSGVTTGSQQNDDRVGMRRSNHRDMDMMKHNTRLYHQVVKIHCMRIPSGR